MTPNMERGARIIIHEWVKVRAWDKVLIVTSKEYLAEAKAMEKEASGRFSGASMVISWPSTRICPLSVFKNPLIILSVVVFPQPDAPRRHNSSPFGRESDKSFTTSFSPKLLLMFFSSKYTFLFPFPCNNNRKQHIY